MNSIELTLINRLGLHARASAKLVKLASSFRAHIEIEKDGNRVNAKSIMGVMMLAATCGSMIEIYADGGDEDSAIDALRDLVERRFDEEQ